MRKNARPRERHGPQPGSSVKTISPSANWPRTNPPLKAVAQLHPTSVPHAAHALAHLQEAHGLRGWRRLCANPCTKTDVEPVLDLLDLHRVAGRGGGQAIHRGARLRSGTLTRHLTDRPASPDRDERLHEGVAEYAKVVAPVHLHEAERFGEAQHDACLGPLPLLPPLSRALSTPRPSSRRALHRTPNRGGNPCTDPEAISRPWANAHLYYDHYYPYCVIMRRQLLCSLLRVML